MKQSYRIPFSINVRRWDATIVPPENWPIKKAFKMTTLLFGGLGGLVLPLWLVFQSPVAGGSLISKAMIIIGWWLFLYSMLRTTETGDAGWESVIPTMAYWFNGRERFVSTRGDVDVTAVQDVLQLRAVDPDGTLYFANNWMGKIYEIDGYASRMLFDNEKALVVDTFDKYLRQLPPNVSVSIPTQHATLDLDDQVRFARRRSEAQTRSDLRGLARAKEKVMDEKISKNFKTINQWMIIMTDDEVQLHDQCVWFETQVRNGMARRARMADQDRAVRLLADFYRP